MTVRLSQVQTHDNSDPYTSYSEPLIFLVSMPDTSEILLANLNAFTGFAQSRLGDPDLARDAVQDCLLKAITAERQPSEESVVPWFYRILRRTIIDLSRRRDARNRALARLGDELNAPADPEEERVLCGCFERLLPQLPEAYAELIRRIDLGGERANDLASERGSSANALIVQHHRARRRLRELLEGSCRVCASHGCLDCDCAGTDG
jgi:RNA polymerase sigma factor (sigma-70 family)